MTADDLIRRVRCRLGLHRRMAREVFLPSITAEVVTEFCFTVECKDCGRILHRFRQVWNGDDFVDAGSEP